MSEIVTQTSDREEAAAEVSRPDINVRTKTSDQEKAAAEATPSKTVVKPSEHEMTEDTTAAETFKVMEKCPEHEMSTETEADINRLSEEKSNEEAVADDKKIIMADDEKSLPDINVGTQTSDQEKVAAVKPSEHEMTEDTTAAETFKVMEKCPEHKMSTETEADINRLSEEKSNEEAVADDKKIIMADDEKSLPDINVGTQTSDQEKVAAVKPSEHEMTEDTTAAETIKVMEKCPEHEMSTEIEADINRLSGEKSNEEAVADDKKIIMADDEKSLPDINVGTQTSDQEKVAAVKPSEHEMTEDTTAAETFKVMEKCPEHKMSTETVADKNLSEQKSTEEAVADDKKIIMADDEKSPPDINMSKIGTQTSDQEEAAAEMPSAKTVVKPSEHKMIEDTTAAETFKVMEKCPEHEMSTETEADINRLSEEKSNEEAVADDKKIIMADDEKSLPDINVGTQTSDQEKVAAVKPSEHEMTEDTTAAETFKVMEKCPEHKMSTETEADINRLSEEKSNEEAVADDKKIIMADDEKSLPDINVGTQTSDQEKVAAVKPSEHEMTEDTTAAETIKVMEKCPEHEMSTEIEADINRLSGEKSNEEAVADDKKIIMADDEKSLPDINVGTQTSDQQKVAAEAPPSKTVVKPSEHEMTEDTAAAKTSKVTKKCPEHEMSTETVADKNLSEQKSTEEAVADDKKIIMADDEKSPPDINMSKIGTQTSDQEEAAAEMPSAKTVVKPSEHKMIEDTVAAIVSKVIKKHPEHEISKETGADELSRNVVKLLEQKTTSPDELTANDEKSLLDKILREWHSFRQDVCKRYNISDRDLTEILKAHDTCSSDEQSQSLGGAPNQTVEAIVTEKNKSKHSTAVTTCLYLEFYTSHSVTT